MQVILLALLTAFLSQTPSLAAVQSRRAAQANKPAPSLQKGKPITRSLERGEVHSYRIALNAGQMLRILIEQRGRGVVATLLAADGRKLRESASDSHLPLSLFLEAEASGDCTLELRPQDEAPNAGYQVLVDILRMPTSQDEDLIAAEHAVLEGDELYARETEEDLGEAINKYQRALRLFEACGDRAGKAQVLGSLWVTNNRLDRQKALNYILEAVTIWRELGFHKAEAILLRVIGMDHEWVGETQEALQCYRRVVEISRQLGDRLGEAGALIIMADLYRSLEVSRALESLNSALSLSKSVGSEEYQARALDGMALCYLLLGDNQKAIAFSNQSLTLRRLRGEKEKSLPLDSIGRAYFALGDNEKALKYFNEALLLEHDRDDEAFFLGATALIYISKGENQKAIDNLNLARPIYRELGSISQESFVLHDIAVAEYQLGNFANAKSRLEEGLSLFELLRSKIISQDLRASLLARSGYYEFYVDVLMQLHKQHPADGFNALALKASERGRGRGMLELLTEIGADIKQGVPLGLLDRKRTLQVQLNASAAADRPVSSLIEELHDVEAEIREKSPHYAALAQPQPLDVSEIQQQVLDPDTLLLEFSLGDRHSYLWVVSQNSLTSFELPKRDVIEKAAQPLIDSLTARGSQANRETAEARRARIARADAQYQTAAVALSNMLLAPAAEMLGKKRLLVVSDGALQYVPLAALPSPVLHNNLTQSAAAGTPAPECLPMMAEHEIVTLPSASTLAVLRKQLAGRKPASNIVTVFADPVFSPDDDRVRLAANSRGTRTGLGIARRPRRQRSGDSLADIRRSTNDVGITRGNQRVPALRSTRREANGILAITRKCEGWSGRTLLGFDANLRTATDSQIGQSSIVHFATHGVLSIEHPELSGILLSLVDEKGRPEDGFLRLHQVYGLDLPVEMVVLSGCETGVGKKVRGEGLIALARGFMHAGARRVVSSLWKVDDLATSQFMEHFYENLLVRRMRPAAALSAAQMQTWKQEQWRAPYYWAAFILQGDW